LHGMAYYIFLKSLRSLGKCKNPIFNSEILFLTFGLADPTARSASGPANPQAKIVPAGPSSPRVGRVFVGNMFSLLDHDFPNRRPLPRLSVNRAPPVRLTPFPVSADPGQKSPAPLPRALDAPSFYSPPSSLSPLNPLQTEP
jgi:hypothetical protein